MVPVILSDSLMAVLLSPSATGTPPSGLPAAGGSDAAASLPTELMSVDDVFLADMAGDTEANAGNDADPDAPDLTDDDDATSEEDSEEATDEDSTEEESDADNNDDPSEGQKAKAGTPAAVLQALQDAKIPHGLIKRIDKAFLHSRTYREEAEALRADLANAPEPITLAPTATHPLSDVQTAEQLEDRRKAADFWLDWCGDNPDGGTVGTGRDARELTHEEVRSQRRWASTVLKSIPERQHYLAIRQASRAAAQKSLPEMFRKDAPEYVAAQALIKGTPELVNQPDYEQTLADTVRGLKYRVMQNQGYTIALIPPSSKKKTAANSAPEPTAANKASPKPRPTAPPHSRPSPSPTGGKPDLASLYAKAATSGNEVDIERLLAAEMAG